MIARLTCPLLPSARLLVAALGAVALLALGACATTRPPTNSALTGHWRLDPAASDNVDAKVTQAIAKAEQNLRKKHRLSAGGPAHNGGPNAGAAGGADGGGGAGDSGDEDSFDSPGDIFGNGATIGPDFHQLREHLLQELAAPSALVVNVQPNSVDIQHDQLPLRDYPSGEVITRFDEYGTARLDSRWSGGAYLLRQRYTSGAQLIERFEVDASGALIYTRSLSDPTLGKLEVKSTYHRA